ncbi:hypothetical protein ACOSP7_021431 [Xanthoceras sorbifolium]
MEDSDKHDMSQETLQQQYEVVKRRTGFDPSFGFELENAQEGSQQNIEAEKQLNNEIYHRQYMDRTINLIATLLFGQKNKSHLLEYVRPAGQPLVDDWDCLKIFV